MLGLRIVHDFYPVVSAADDGANSNDIDVKELAMRFQLNPGVLEW
jgi:hypothetical protein